MPTDFLVGVVGHVDPDEQDWKDQAVCATVDPEIFFPEKGGSTREAKAVCTSCPVKDQCLEDALLHGERFGIWGGFSERERRKLPSYQGGHYSSPGVNSATGQYPQRKEHR